MGASQSTPNVNVTPTPDANAGQTHERPMNMTNRNVGYTLIWKRCSLTHGVRQREKLFDNPEYQEETLETEKENHSEKEGDQGHSRRKTNTHGASNYSIGEHLLIKPKLSPFVLEILNHPMPRIKMLSCE